MKEFGKNYETFLAALYISINRWTPVWTSMLCCLRYCGVEVGTSDLVNWEGPWMPRGPDLGVLPSLHGVMYKHWIIKLHLSISPPPTRGRLCQPLSRHLLYLQSANPPLKSGHFLLFLDFLCFVSIYCLLLSAIFLAVIASKEWEAGNSKRR